MKNWSDSRAPFFTGLRLTIRLWHLEEPRFGIEVEAKSHPRRLFVGLLSVGQLLTNSYLLRQLYR